MLPVLQFTAKVRFNALIECSLTVHPAAHGYLVATIGSKGSKERNWLPYLTCR